MLNPDSIKFYFRQNLSISAFFMCFKSFSGLLLTSVSTIMHGLYFSMDSSITHARCYYSYKRISLHSFAASMSFCVCV
jgi:hypothetical protein